MQVTTAYTSIGCATLSTVRVWASAILSGSTFPLFTTLQVAVPDEDLRVTLKEGNFECCRYAILIPEPAPPFSGTVPLYTEPAH